MFSHDRKSLSQNLLMALALLVATFSLFPFQLAYATGIRYATPSGTGDCSSWGSACSLQTALTGAVSGNEVWAKTGTYKPTTGTDRTATFQLKAGVALYGGFAGTETERDQRDPVGNVTVLSGDIDNNDSQAPILTDLKTVTGNTTNSYHVVTGATGATLDGFTVTAGYANSEIFPFNCGGGLYNTGSSPTLTNLTFSGNWATNSGGGIRNDSSSPTLTNVTFSGNSAGRGGGGMINISSTPTLTDVTFNGNTTPADGSGGGLYNYSSSPALTRVSFNANSADYGGGIYNRLNSSPTLTDVVFSGNTAGLQGGGMENVNDSSPALMNVTFSDNSTTGTYGSGGGMRNFSGSNPILTNVTFSHNSATYGGGINNESNASPTLTNVTLSGNSANLQGGGIYNFSSSPRIRNTIFWNNSATSAGAQIYDNSSAPSVEDSIVQDGYAGGMNIITADPLLGTLGEYGGFTRTIALLPGSSAIDTGNDALCPATDQRGVVRPQGPHCDIGAYELNNTLALLLSPSGLVPAGWDGTFQWTGVTGASMYYVQILQANDTNVWTQWYPAAGNCAGLSCHITLSSLSNLPTGAYKWRVLDWGDYGYGAWTDFTPFTTNTACYALTTSVLPAGSGVVNATAPNCGANYLAGTVVQLTAVPNSGYLFNNWSGGASGTANPVSITMTGDMTVTANLRETSSTLVSPSGAVPAGWDGTFQWTGVTGASMYYVQILQANDANVWTQWFDAAGNCTGLSCHITLSSLSSLPSGGYKWRVLDWGSYGYGAWTDFTPFTTNPACYALTTSVVPVGSSTINATAQNCTGGYLPGTVVQLTAVPNAGYVFNNWSGGASGTANPVSITMTGDMTVTANLRETSSTLVSPSGAVPAGWDGTFQWTGVTGASMYYVQILQANDTNVWTQWFDAAGNCTGLSCHITLSSLSNLPTGAYKWRVLDWGGYGYGAWTDFTAFNTTQACYALTTSVLPAGSGVVNATAPNCGANYLAGTVVQLTAVPNAGYVFNSWSGGASGTANPVSITMTGDMTVTANLRETSSTLVSPSGAVPAGWDGTFQWTGVTGASMYYVQILQANDANVWTQWFDAAGNCTGLSCHITLSSLSSLPTGTYKWRVLDWGSYGYGAWTAFTEFQMP